MQLWIRLKDLQVPLISSNAVKYVIIFNKTHFWVIEWTTTGTAAQKKMTDGVNMDRHTLPTDLFPEKLLNVLGLCRTCAKMSQKGRTFFFNITESSLIHTFSLSFFNKIHLSHLLGNSTITSFHDTSQRYGFTQTRFTVMQKVWPGPIFHRLHAHVTNH